MLSRIQQGVTQDFGVPLSDPGGFWRSGLKYWGYVRLPTVGPAGQSGAWQRWERQDPVGGRFPFFVDIDDRRAPAATCSRRWRGSGRSSSRW